MNDNQNSRLEDISTIAIDSTHMYIHETENLDFNKDENFNIKIEAHPLMIRETSVQKSIISYLETISQVTPDDVELLIKLQGKDIGSLALGKVSSCQVNS